MATVLICDDEKNIRRTLKLVIAGEGHEVLEAERAESALRLLEEVGADVVLLDVKLPGMDGIEALSRIRERWPAVEVIMISGHATVSEAAEATRRGAYDFFEKPLDRDRVLVSLRNVIDKVRLAQKVADLSPDEEELLGESAAIREVKQIIAKVAPTGGRVLITGESGTGKELIARAIHRQSRRADKPFVKVNCAAIPSELIESELFGHEKGAFSGATARKRGRFELADGGTIFLDEIGDMPLGAQAKVLRVLQNGELTRVGGERTFTVDVRVLAATNKDLKAEVEAGRFREDLFFRLNVVPIHAPPLRERPEDIPLLVEAFLEQLARTHGLKKPEVDTAVFETLRRYTFPGNVRELRNIVERMLILAGDRIGEADLPLEVRQEPGRAKGLFDLDRYRGLTLRQLRDAVEREYIRETLVACDWNVTRAAELLGVERTNLHKKMRSHGIEREG
ncbi:MAG: sigma-54-dependent Fis family transcriptional regulator [Deltaproteobacteria bacterium]|nr:MAG: sigma-54-dependent Fis family transcriptional regulator [Deltaproteobacteria bacterium]